MAVDTRNKRFSLLGLAVPMALVLPLADATIGQADRQQFAYCYSGIAFEAASALNLHTATTQSLMPERMTAFAGSTRLTESEMAERTTEAT